MDILLKDGAIKSEVVATLGYPNDDEMNALRGLCRAQVRKVEKWQGELCDQIGHWRNVRRRDCPYCRLALREAAGEGKDAPPTPISYPARTELGKRLVDLRNEAAGEGK